MMDEMTKLQMQMLPIRSKVALCDTAKQLHDVLEAGGVVEEVITALSMGESLDHLASGLDVHPSMLKKAMYSSNYARTRYLSATMFHAGMNSLDTMIGGQVYSSLDFTKERAAAMSHHRAMVEQAARIGTKMLELEVKARSKDAPQIVVHNTTTSANIVPPPIPSELRTVVIENGET